MSQVTDTDIRSLKESIDANNQSIIDLKDSISSLREETRVGLTKLDGDIRELRSDVKTLDTKLNGDIRELRSDVKTLDTKFDERTKLGFWGFILRGVVLTAIVAFATYLLPIFSVYVNKLPSP
jgi:predicted RNase H-like nuclease (RuvC/YqgF family)